MLLLYGEEVIPLSKIVKELALKQGNMKETAVFQQLVYARWAWKDIFRKYIWSIKNQVCQLDHNHTFRKPEDCERIVNISVVDRYGKIQPLDCDPGLNTVAISCIKAKCSCPNCHGDNTLCAAAENAITYTTETVVIQGVDYTLQTWVRYSGGGIQQEQKIPVWNAATNSVVYNTEYTTLCNIEVTDKGCIKATPANMELLRTYCGADHNPGLFPFWYQQNNLIPVPYNYYGYWNVNAADPNIIHVFRHDRQPMGHHVPPTERDAICKVIVSYQTSGETSGDEIMVPQYAQLAIDTGIMWQQKLYNPRESVNNKQFYKNEYNAAKLDLNKFLNPIRLELVAKLQTQMRRW